MFLCQKMTYIIDSHSASLSFLRSSNLSFQLQLRPRFTAGHLDSISLNFVSLYHWSLEFASSNRKAVNHFPPQNINCHKLKFYQLVVRKCSALLIFYDFVPSNRLAFALGLATVIQADRLILQDELRFRPIRQSGV